MDHGVGSKLNDNNDTRTDGDHVTLVEPSSFGLCCLFAIIKLPSRRQLLKWVMLKKHSTRFRPLPCFVFDIVEGPGTFSCLPFWGIDHPFALDMLKKMRCLGRSAKSFGHVWPCLAVAIWGTFYSKGNFKDGYLTFVYGALVIFVYFCGH